MVTDDTDAHLSYSSIIQFSRSNGQGIQPDYWNKLLFSNFIQQSVHRESNISYHV